jgi:hypothetical protein
MKAIIGSIIDALQFTFILIWDCLWAAVVAGMIWSMLGL